jgi:pilus assembly protein FimV
MGMARETQGSPASEKRLEQYGVWVKVKPREVIETAPLEDSFELSDLDASPGDSRSSDGGGGALTAEEEQLLDELDTELSPDSESGDVFVPEEEPLLAEGELPDIESAGGRSEAPTIALGQESEEELPELEEERELTSRSEVEVTLSEDLKERDHFDDLDALESELATVRTGGHESSAGSAQILARIESELKSIRTDLTQLRTELSGLRKSAAVAEEEAPAAAAQSGGFFDEDEDETIALTGDELDNILNTADITEEAAEAQTVDIDIGEGSAEVGGLDIETTLEVPTLETEAVPASEDILSYETPTLEEGSIAAAAPVAESDDTLVLSEEPLLSADDDLVGLESTADVDELPAELVLDELSIETPSAPREAAPADLPEIEMEGIPELEVEPLPAAPAESTEDESETIDLETLDLGEEPTVIDAVPEQVEDAEDLLDLEALPETGPARGEEKAKAASFDELETIADDVDLEALALEAEELEDSTPIAPKVDLDELSDVPLAEEVAEPTEDEIEIAFESEPGEAPAAAVDEVEDAEEIAALEELADEVSEESLPASGGAQPAAAAAEIPDNLKDEIRTVLKYMDHLLEALPDEKIQEFASSDYFVMYKKLFEDLGLGD